ncbi:MAG: DoxX family protein [Saprospiraceae bacterium]|nr:DoxX family protein [Saprospiraceae bacterium]
MKDIIDLIARMCLSGIFLFEAFTSIKFMGRTKETMQQYGFTWNQDLLLYSTIFALTVGGIFLLIGYRTTFAVFLLLIYWVPVTFTVYSFWNDPSNVRNIHSIIFMKNIAIIGGLLLVWIHDPGKYSIKRLVGMTKLPKEKW